MIHRLLALPIVLVVGCSVPNPAFEAPIVEARSLPAADRAAPLPPENVGKPTAEMIAAVVAPGEPLVADPVNVPAPVRSWKERQPGWTFGADGIVTGRGDHPDWAIADSGKPLPRNYRVHARMRPTTQTCAELMLNLCGNEYTRVYLYAVDENVVLGHGHLSADGEHDTGPTLVAQDMDIDVGEWHDVEVNVSGSLYEVFVDGDRKLVWQDSKGELPRCGSLGLATGGGAEFTDVWVLPLPG